jgi:hypothetical protein
MAKNAVESTPAFFPDPEKFAGTKLSIFRLSVDLYNN